LGVVAIGVGSGFGALAFIKNGDANAQCPFNHCTPPGQDLDRQARTAATVSTVAFTVGAAAAVTSVIFFVVHRPAPRSPAIAVSPLGIDLRGRW
jgi:hypothetical protein